MPNFEADDNWSDAPYLVKPQESIRDCKHQPEYYMDGNTPNEVVLHCRKCEGFRFDPGGRWKRVLVVKSYLGEDVTLGSKRRKNVEERHRSF